LSGSRIPVLLQQFVPTAAADRGQIDNAAANYGARQKTGDLFPEDQDDNQAVMFALKQFRLNKPLAPDFRDIRALTPEVDEQKFAASLKLMRKRGAWYS